MKHFQTILTLICLATLPLPADTLVEISRIKIPLGRGDAQIGLEEGGGEHWKPLFFSIDNNANIHIPDFYKARIAVFDKSGKLIKKIPCPAGISPRMNYFGRSPNGRYVTYNDGALCSIDRDGKLLWQHGFGFGVIPARVVLADSAIFVVFTEHMDEDGRAVVFDYGTSTPLGRYGVTVDKKNIPLFQWSEESVFTTKLADMSLLEGKKGTFGNDTDMLFLFADEKDNSFWTKKKDNRETIALYSADGKKLKESSIYIPDQVSGTGFRTAADNNQIIYKNYYQKNYMEIVGYQFK